MKKTIYVNRKDEAMKGEIIATTEKGVTIQLEDGTAKDVTTSTLKRWWKKEEIEVEDAPAPKKERKKQEMTEDAKALMQYAFAEVENAGGEVWEPAKDIKMRAFKVGGHMFIKFNYANNGITLHCRKAAVEEVAEPNHIYNHCFNYAYTFKELTKDNKKLITKLIKASIKHQQTKNENAGKKNKKNKKGEDTAA